MPKNYNFLAGKISGRYDATLNKILWWLDLENQGPTLRLAQYADELPYDNTTSLLAATDVQAAIDELAAATTNMLDGNADYQTAWWNDGLKQWEPSDLIVSVGALPAGIAATDPDNFGVGVWYNGQSHTNTSIQLTYANVTSDYWAGSTFKQGTNKSIVGVNDAGSAVVMSEITGSNYSYFQAMSDVHGAGAAKRAEAAYYATAMRYSKITLDEAATNPRITSKTYLDANNNITEVFDPSTSKATTVTIGGGNTTTVTQNGASLTINASLVVKTGSLTAAIPGPVISNREYMIKLAGTGQVNLPLIGGAACDVGQTFVLFNTTGSSIKIVPNAADTIYGAGQPVGGWIFATPFDLGSNESVTVVAHSATEWYVV